MKGSMMRFFNLGRTGLAIAAFAALGALSACTTVEGTNALVDAETFEREVATETLKGLGMIDRERKPVIKTPRAPLVLPKNQAAIPAPSDSKIADLQLPEDSDKVKIDTSGLTEDDIRRLRNARVVDLRTISGRPLTDVEARKLTARMKAARIAYSSKTERPLYLPPDEYFTTIGGQDLICLAENGDLVPLDDPACPPEIKAALQTQPAKQ